MSIMVLVEYWSTSLFNQTLNTHKVITHKLITNCSYEIRFPYIKIFKIMNCFRVKNCNDKKEKHYVLY